MSIIALLSEWLNLLLRWAHIIIGIGWIGASFYFVWLDIAFKPRDKMRPGVFGTVWMVHGGGFYHVEKYTVAPARLPPDLHWFKWEAYLTWVTGFSLLVLQYYINAKSYLIDPSVMDIEPWQAIVASLSSLLFGWLIYDGLCRSPIGKKPVLLAAILFAILLAATAFYSQIFSGRGALIHVGALIGTWMAANVFMVIIPRQDKAAKSLMRGEEADPSHGIIAKQRSMHNNYLTLPVLLMMVASHYPGLVSHQWKWLIVGLIIISGAMVRHFINLHDAGNSFKSTAWTLAIAAFAFVSAAAVSGIRPERTGDLSAVSDTEVMAIVNRNCAVCHAAAPSHEAFDEPPAGIKFENVDALRRYAEQVRAQAVIGQTMPLGNETAMTRQERDKLGIWLDQQ